MPSSTLFTKLCQLKRLRAAWKVVQQSGLASQSEDTRKDAADFANGLEQKLRAILLDLKNGRFQFAPAKAIAIKAKGKPKKRPIVLAPIKNRIVQRAMLDIIQSLKPIRKIVWSGHNFGGIDDGGVPKAIKAVYQVSQKSIYFVRSDIKGFFDNVPREAAIAQITKHFGQDDAFAQLFKSAVNVELDNLASLPEDERKLFPSEDTGVAQGSALSPLICNIYLSNFDSKLNGREVVCFRYIDDFIILGPSRKITRAALNSGLKMLQKLGLEAYDPKITPAKAEEGLIANGFEFLGCSIKAGNVIPNAKSRARLLEKIDDIFRRSLRFADKPAKFRPDKATLSEAITRASNTVRGWGNTYFFCNDARIFSQLDLELDERSRDFFARYLKRAKKLGLSDWRRSVGIRLLSERNYNPNFFA